MDWTHAEVAPVLSAAAVSLGVTTAALGSWVEKVGPRKAGFVGSLLWSSGLITTGAGVYMHSLPLVYTGYGFLGGVGWGLMYVSPVTTIMKWFSDKKGLATGIALSAFGAGAAVAPALIHSTVDFFAEAPHFIGPLADVALQTLSDGSQVIAENSQLGEPGQPVVVATEADIAKVHSIDTGAGVYALGSGDTGIAQAFGALGVGYGIMGMLGSRFMSIPHPDWTPKGPVAKQNEGDNSKDIVNANDEGLPTSYAVSSTLQFPLLWISVFGNATGGLALISSSKLMLTDIWAGVAPDVVTSSFATGYVSALGIGMALGRFSWSAVSDFLGRRNTYALFGLGIPIVGFAPALTHAAVSYAADGSSVLPMLGAFYGGSLLAVSFYGGIFSVSV